MTLQLRAARAAWRPFAERKRVKRFIPGFLLAVLLAVPVPALAQRGQGWSVLAADTVGQGRNVFTGQIGYPGLTLGLLHGGSDRVDIGGKFSFNWGREGLVDATDEGLKLQLWLRIMLAKTSNVSFALTFQPGTFVYFPRNNTAFGMVFPVGFVVGIPVGSALTLNAGIDIPFNVYIGEGIGPVIPILFGGGLEYFVNNQFNVNFNLRMGPSIFPRFDDSAFTMEALAGVAYRF
ncbi:hypothetical protein D7V88_28680 [Corallococcus terminator]|uniref:Outer membrane protein beta-barrel domain-containing protein n=1 Tax=Corallococcus terminator TaxID=2316733 RepID=A0A3A8I7P0_9BACT|nr:hypothetical protein D7V88_28680 [Corallococcus terminator]